MSEDPIPYGDPLHVKVARALGCKPEIMGQYSGGDMWGCTCGLPQARFIPTLDPRTRALDRPDTDWK